MKETCYLTSDLYPARLRLIGRHTKCAEGRTLDYSASGAVFALRAETETAVDLTFTTFGEVDGGSVYFTVYLDGARLDERLFVEGAPDSKTIATRTVRACTVSAGEHVVRVVRQSNFWHGCTALVSLTTKAEVLAAPAPRAKTIEFIGDSLTCGYGVMPDAVSAPREVCGKSIYCDATQAHAFLAAEKLDADAILCGYSGWGLLCGAAEEIADSERARMLLTIPQIYPFASHFRGTEPYIPKVIPDLIVVNLGSNDGSRRKLLALDAQKFKTAVQYFLYQLRIYYGREIPIVQAYGYDHRELIPLIREAIAEAGGAEKGYYFCELPADNAGGNRHPSAAGQALGAEILADFIRANGLLGT